jgi:cyanophycinase-like exopeptidase
VLEADPTLFGLAVDESTAAIVEKGVITVAGESYVLVYDQLDWDRQKKEWGRVYIPFKMIQKGFSFDLSKRILIRN